ncbi:MAG: ribonuclease HI [Clostridiales bacterium]|nr:ribonuclease HI [Clostridiales bacterium]
MIHVDIYTDGACSGNPGPGGWGSILICRGVEKEISGGEKLTTNNRMELTAAIAALKCLKKPCDVTLYSDSAYLVNGFNAGWIVSWKRNGWKNSSKQTVSNIDLWQEIDALASVHRVTWVKVKGHADNVYNNRCDALAVAATKKQGEMLK